VFVVAVTRKLPGAPGMPGCGGVPPAHDAPLSVQLVGSPLPLATKPKLAVAPGVSVPFQPTLVTVMWPDEPVRLPSHDELIAVPEGRSKATVQPLIVDVVALVIEGGRAPLVGYVTANLVNSKDVGL
jgi:hypothetical protein